VDLPVGITQREFIEEKVRGRGKGRKKKEKKKEARRGRKPRPVPYGNFGTKGSSLPVKKGESQK